MRKIFVIGNLVFLPVLGKDLWLATLNGLVSLAPEGFVTLVYILDKYSFDPELRTFDTLTDLLKSNTLN